MKSQYRKPKYKIIFYTWNTR